MVINFTDLILFPPEFSCLKIRENITLCFHACAKSRERTARLDLFLELSCGVFEECYFDHSVLKTANTKFNHKKLG
jgi:hypothetical protein